ncbi:hypothetical protein N7517_011494 [Penicillium concentricum]|uniref:Uncharacterized protein n=1 Tax=Penicillium concentricum TaxID=293559 RepID=A0A9W9RAX1_9EURO|nr:uncharacterized protein N7517_011494 [Penicillium concentricum]KAJ5356885.1 hypothetical protein N7517_011494 [Penicillium concentricum]
MPLHSPFGSLDGATALTLFAITQTENLAETIEEHELQNAPVPANLSAGIASLSAHLQNFGPDYDIPLFVNPDMDKQDIIYNNLEVAWYIAAGMYFHNRIDNTFIDDMSFAVNGILMCLLRAEEIKAQVEPDVMYRDDPVTFPAFVASLNAIDRDPWVRWWDAVQRYGFPNVKAQWEVIQIVWDIMDSMQEIRGVDLIWVDVMKGREARRLSTVFEELDFY